MSKQFIDGQVKLAFMRCNKTLADAWKHYPDDLLPEGASKAEVLASAFDLLAERLRAQAVKIREMAQKDQKEIDGFRRFREERRS